MDMSGLACKQEQGSSVGSARLKIVKFGNLTFILMAL